MQITVVGCGVSGLTTSVELQTRGHCVQIVARELPHDCVSVVAGAIWGPTSVEPRHRTGPWSLVSRERFAALAELPDTGVAPMVHLDLHRESAPHWSEDLPWVTRVGPEHCPPGYPAALRIDGFRIDPPTYLQWLLDRFEAGGGTITLEAVTSLEGLEGEVIVNCSGLGAVELADDSSMFPIRGQMVLVDNSDQIGNGISDETDQDRISYVYPRTRHLYLGGARQIGDDRTEVDPALTARILADAPRLDPRVTGRAVDDVRVGLRPGRPEVRLEATTLADGRPLIHNYGHSGAGYIMSWGCAAEVADLADVAGAAATGSEV